MLGRAIWAFLTFAVAAMEGAEAKLYLQVGHSDGVTSVAFSPDGRWALTGGASDDKTARLWDVATGMEIRRLEGHTSGVTSVAFSPDGRWALTGSQDATARLWDVATGRQIRLLKDGVSDVNWVAFSSDGASVMTNCDDRGRLWDLATGHVLRRLEWHADRPIPAAFSSDGRWALTGSDDNSARLWDAVTGQQIRRLEGHSDAVSSVAFSADGRFALTGSRDKTARIWDVATGREMQRLEGHGFWVNSVTFSPDGRWALTAGTGSVAHLWDVATGKELRRLEGHSKGVNSVAFSADGQRALTGSWDRSAKVWDVTTGREIQRLEGHSKSLTSVAFSPDGRWLQTGGWDGTARLWEVASGQQVRRMAVDSAIVTSVAFSPNGLWTLTGSRDKMAQVWDLASGRQLWRLEGHSEAVTSVAFSPDLRWALTGSEDKTARLWDAASGHEIRRLEGHTASVTSVAFSNQGRWAVTGSSDNSARVWDVAAGREIQRLDEPDPVFSVAVSPDGRWALAGTWDRSVPLWEVATGKQVRRLQGHSQSVTSVAFSPDGRWALTGSLDMTARLWDVATGRELQRLEGHSGNVASAVFSPDGHWVLTGSQDGSARLWDAKSGKFLATLVSFDESGWAVVDPDGRFDTSNLDGGAPLHWILDSDPMRPLPLEIFMRDYYTPRLLPRILNGENLAPLPRVPDIRNLVQPHVEIVKIEPSPGVPNRVSVAVRAAGKTENGQASGLQDLRLFRNGQMVGYLEGPLKDDAYVFRNVQLPFSEKKVTLTAYAFNSARIKSPTVERDFAYAPARPANPKAYLVQIGVNHYQAGGCELRYAANDARKLLAALEERLKARGLEVKAAGLVDAKKEQIRAVLAGVAAEATPDDVFFLSFSGHGYTSKEGQFYILPSDIQGSCGNPTAELMKTAISADELTEWLRPIDAGEMTFILDSCYSAQSVEANDFKPGPMGSRGLGQLAYDKRMRILAASQSDAAAMEDSRLQQGLLSYFLTEQGLQEGKADWKPVDSRITIGEWLNYAADQVPKWNAPPNQYDSGRGIRLDLIRRSQVPAVFDFSKKDDFVIK